MVNFFSLSPSLFPILYDEKIVSTFAIFQGRGELTQTNFLGKKLLEQFPFPTAALTLLSSLGVQEANIFYATLLRMRWHMYKLKW